MRAVVDVAVSPDGRQQSAFVAGAGQVIGPDLVLHDASGVQVAGPHGGIGLLVDVTAAKVNLVQGGRFERQGRGCCQLVRRQWLVSVDDVVRGILSPQDGSPQPVEPFDVLLGLFGRPSCPEESLLGGVVSGAAAPLFGTVDTIQLAGQRGQAPRSRLQIKVLPR